VDREILEQRHPEARGLPVSPGSLPSGTPGRGSWSGLDSELGASRAGPSGPADARPPGAGAGSPRSRGYVVRLSLPPAAALPDAGAPSAPPASLPDGAASCGTHCRRPAPKPGHFGAAGLSNTGACRARRLARPLSGIRLRDRAAGGLPPSQTDGHSIGRWERGSGSLVRRRPDLRSRPGEIDGFCL
jgi:hypothetical protein